jgi:hypothetical protein
MDKADKPFVSWLSLRKSERIWAKTLYREDFEALKLSISKGLASQ